MDKRIQKLWDLSRYPSGRGHDEKKFAELIVRECHNYFYDDSVPFNGVDGLLAHFGVEE